MHSPVIRDKNDIGQLDGPFLPQPVGVVSICLASSCRFVCDSSQHGMEFNCSQYEFDSDPPNVGQHLEGIISIHLMQVNFISY